MTLRMSRIVDVPAQAVLTPYTGVFTSNLPETDATAWSAATNYVIGNRVMIAGTTHKVWEAVGANLNKDPLLAVNVYSATNPTGVWLYVGFTNRWRIFDGSISGGSDAGALDNLYWVLGAGSDLAAPAPPSIMALMNVSGKELVVYRRNSNVAQINFAERSEGFTQTSAWAAILSTLTADFGRDPLLLSNADQVLETVTASEKGVDSIGTRAYISGNTYTISVYAKRAATGTGRNLRLTMPTGAFGASFGNFTLSGAGTAVSGAGAVTAAIVALAGGWYRCSVTKIATASTTTTVGSFRILDAALSATYTGATNSGLLVFGFQNNDGTLAAYQGMGVAGTWYDRTLLKYVDWAAITDTLFSADIYVSIPTYLFTDQFDVFVQRRVIPSSAPTLGEVVFGYEDITLGELIEPVESGFLDFSVKSRDDFGNLVLKQRNLADDTNYAFNVVKSQRQTVKTIIRSRRAVPLMFWESDDPDNLWGLLTYGFIRGYSMPALGADTNLVTLDTEGFT